MTETPDEQKGFLWAAYIAWNFFDGKKTSIGTALIAIAGYSEGLRMAIESAGGDPWKLFYNITTVTGTFFAAGGLIHKNYKLKNQNQQDTSA